MEIINKKLILKKSNIETKEDLFKVIADALKSNKYISRSESVIKDLSERESLGSTAFENGLMIPHCRTSALKEPKIVIVKFNNVDFESIDKQKTNFAVSILVPENAGSEHLVILSKLSKLFSTKKTLTEFKKLTIEKQVQKIETVISKKEKQIPKSQKVFDFVAVTSCAAGIAHTYMARDGIMEAAEKMGLKVKIETRGAITENSLTSKEIEDAKFVVIAADVSINKARFSGKKLFSTDTNSAIKDGKLVIEKAQKAPVFYGKTQKMGKLTIGGTDKSKQKTLSKAIMSALSFMIPIVIAGGILMSIPNAMAAGGNSHGGTWKFPNKFTEGIWNFGHIGLLMMVPIFSMFLAFKIGGKPAMPAALIGGYFINDGALMGKFSLIDLPKQVAGSASAGFLGGIVVGILVGYLVKLMQWIKWHKWIKPVSNLMLVPIISSFLTFLIVVYIVGSPMTWIMSELYIGLAKINNGGTGAAIGVGMLFAILISIDLGGPINKTALTVATVIFADTLTKGTPNFVPQTAVQAAISVPPLGMWLATVIFRKKFSKTEIAAGQAALPMGLVGVTEGALPFAFKTPIKAIIANMSGATVAGALVSLLHVNFYGGLGSPLGAYIGYATNSFYGLKWIFAILMGVITTGLIYGLWRKKVPEYEMQYAEVKAKRIAKHKELGLNTKLQVFKYYGKIKASKSKSIFLHSINPKNWIEKPNTDEHEL